MLAPRDPGMSRRAARDRARQERRDDRKAREEARRGSMRDPPVRPRKREPRKDALAWCYPGPYRIPQGSLDGRGR